MWGLDDYNTTKNTWQGTDVSNPTKWDVVANWTGGHVPYTTDDVLIPAGKSNYPILTLDIEIKSLEIASGASLTAGAYTLTINGSTGAWNNNGTFDPGTGTVNLTHGIITDIVSVSGTTQFHNITIAANTFVRPGTSTVMKISGDVIGGITSVVDFSTYGNTVEYNGGNQNIPNPLTIGFAQTGYYNLIIGGTGTKTLIYSDRLDIAGNLTTNATLNVSSATVYITGTSAQNISGSVIPDFNNLTVNNSAGVTSSVDLNVNGVLYLQSANPSSTSGTLEMTGNTLSLGINSNVTGIGDVTGTVKRNHLFADNTYYPFTSANHGITFTGLPNQSSNPLTISMNNSIGTTPDWSSCGNSNFDNPAKRVYTVWTNGTWGTSKGFFRVRYLTSEIPEGVNPGLLTIWSKIESAGCTVAELGKSNQDLENSFVTIGNIPISIFPATQGPRQITLAPTSTGNLTWNGSQSIDMTNSLNWTPVGTPSSDYGLLIPSASSTPYSPELSGNGTVTCNNITLEPEAVLNSSGTPTLELTGSGLVWTGEAGSIFNSAGSTVSINCLTPSSSSNIAGIANFNNLTIQSGSTMVPGGGSYIRIAGALAISGTLDAVILENTIEFNGGSPQDIPNPNGSIAGYHNLTLSGSGTKNLPATLNVSNEFINNATGTVNINSGTVIFDGNANGEVIGGTTTTIFNNLTINNPYGIALENNETVTGTLTLTSGIITTGTNMLIMGSAGSSGTVTRSSGHINGNFRRYVPTGAVTAFTLPVGDATNYTPVSIDFTGSVTGTGFLDASTAVAQPPATSGLSQTKYINRKWTVTNTGVEDLHHIAPALHFTDGDKVGSPGTLAMRILSGSSWYTTSSTTSGNIVTATGLTSFGDYYIGEDPCVNYSTSVWIGASGTDWNTGSNWCGGSVPTPTTDVTIPSSQINQPVIGSAGGTCKNITVESGASLTISGSYTLDVKGTWSNSGTFTAENGTVSFTGSSAQTITGATTFNNLTINNPTGVTAANNITVNGILTLTSTNPNSTQGTLDMGIFTLSMLDETATVSGNGDVTGIVRRKHSFNPNTPYQFGSQYTTINFLGIGTQPDEISCRINIGAELPGRQVLY